MCLCYLPKVSQRIISLFLSRFILLLSLSICIRRRKCWGFFPYGCCTFFLSQSLSYLVAQKELALNFTFLPSSIFVQHILMTLFFLPSVLFPWTTFSPLVLCFEFLFFSRASLLILSCLSFIWTWLHEYHSVRSRCNMYSLFYLSNLYDLFAQYHKR